MSGYAAEASNPTYWIAFSMKWNIVFDNKKLFDICFLNSSLSSQVGRISSASSDHLFKVHLGCRVTLRVIRVWVSGYAAEASNPTYRIGIKPGNEGGGSGPPGKAVRGRLNPNSPELRIFNIKTRLGASVVDRIPVYTGGIVDPDQVVIWI